MIDPQDMINRLTVEELCITAENYFKSIPAPTPQMAKPFNSVLEAPIELQNLGLLLSGLHLGQTMTVVDFGAGSCWLSRLLTQLLCQTISCDVSETALEIGKRLFVEYPIIGTPIAEPRFLHLDGHTIDLPDQSVDRIVCFGAFHHVPNQEEVLAEFYRILRNGGIVGFSEPGRFHSQAPTSQYEMANFNVLENDINLNGIFAIARRYGFTDIKCKLLGDMELSLDAYNLLIRGKGQSRIRRLIGAVRDAMSRRHADLHWRVVDNIGSTMVNRTIFFLHKGEFIPDSRSHVGLSHIIEVENRDYDVTVGEDVDIPLRITNNGGAIWLTTNVRDIGVVKVGTHMYDANDKLLDLDFSRHAFAHTVKPSEVVHKTITLAFQGTGTFKIAIDLVAESIGWFSNLGSKPEFITVHVMEKV